MSFSEKQIKWVVTCEHGGHKIPHDFKYLLPAMGEALTTHRGEDIGVKAAFNQFKAISDFRIINQISRLLIEFNRSLHHPKLFSGFSRNISPKEKKLLIDHYYLPYRNRIEKSVAEFISNNYLVIHLSIHSFTPVLDGLERTTDIGLLYDPKREDEKRFCQLWKDRCKDELHRYKMRMNYPYLGKADGLVTSLRKKFKEHYLGIEVELNQKHKEDFERISGVMAACLRDAVVKS